MTPKPSLSRSNRAVALGNGLAVILAWAIGLTGTTVPAEVALAFATVLSIVLAAVVKD